MSEENFLTLEEWMWTIIHFLGIFLNLLQSAEIR